MGFANVDDLLTQISSRRLAEWMAYSQLEPWGDELIDLHMADLKAILINANLKKNAPRVDAKKLRLWKRIEKFDAQAYYDQLKAALTFKKWE